jgi:hypothetical protein
MSGVERNGELRLLSGLRHDRGSYASLARAMEPVLARL